MAWTLTRNLLDSAGGRRLVFASLYFSEGAPIGYLWWAMPTRLRAAGVAVDEVAGIVALLALPWAFKFLWAPLVDTFRTPRWRLRAWIVSSQLCMGVTLVPVAFLSPLDDRVLLTAVLIAHAVVASLQDVAVDAYTILQIAPAERGAINAWMQIGMLAGRAVFGGASLVVEYWIGPEAVIAALIACIWWSTLLLRFCPSDAPADRGTVGAAHRWRSFGATLGRALRRQSTWLGLGFAATAGAGFEAVGAVAGPLLIDRGLSEAGVGTFFAGPVIVLMAIGALVGGRLSDRLRRTTAVGLLLVITAAAIAAVAAASKAGPAGVVLALSGLYLAIGAFTAASYALFMDITDARLGATQFSAYMGATNLCEVWSAYAVGKLIVRYDYGGAFLLMAAASLAALPVVRRLSDVRRADRQSDFAGERPSEL